MTEDQKYYLKIFLGVVALFTLLTLLKSHMCKSAEGFADGQGDKKEQEKNALPENPLIAMKKIHDGLSQLRTKIENEKGALQQEILKMDNIRKELVELKSKKTKLPEEVEKLLIKDLTTDKLHGENAVVEVKDIVSGKGTFKDLVVEGNVTLPKGFMSKLSENAAAADPKSEDGPARKTFDEIVLRKKNMRLGTSKSKKAHVRRGKTFDETIEDPEKCFDKCRKTKIKVGKSRRKANACTHSDDGECRCAYMRRLRPDKFSKKKGWTSFVAI